MRKVVGTLLAALAIAFLVGGVYAVQQGREATSNVKATLVAQHITTTEDSALPNVPVNNYESAVAQADIIGVHATDAVKGMLGEDLTYAQIPHENADGTPLAPDDPRLAARGLLVQATTLRSALYGSALAFKVAELVTALGFAFAAIGFAFALGSAAVFGKS